MGMLRGEGEEGIWCRYMVFSLLNVLVYCFPVCWAWNETGWLWAMGFHDFAGGCVVHMTGGASAFVAAWFLGPRLGADSIGVIRTTACSRPFHLEYAYGHVIASDSAHRHIYAVVGMAILQLRLNIRSRGRQLEDRGKNRLQHAQWVDWRRYHRSGRELHQNTRQSG